MTGQIGQLQVFLDNCPDNWDDAAAVWDGKKVREVLDKAGLSQADFARFYGLHEKSVQRAVAWTESPSKETKTVQALRDAEDRIRKGLSFDLDDSPPAFDRRALMDEISAALVDLSDDELHELRGRVKLSQARALARRYRDAVLDELGITAPDAALDSAGQSEQARQAAARAKQVRQASPPGHRAQADE